MQTPHQSLLPNCFYPSNPWKPNWVEPQPDRTVKTQCSYYTDQETEAQREGRTYSRAGLEQGLKPQLKPGSLLQECFLGNNRGGPRKSALLCYFSLNPWCSSPVASFWGFSRNFPYENVNEDEENLFMFRREFYLGEKHQ